MFHQRKNFNNAWTLFSLDKEEVKQVRTLAVVQGLKVLGTINKVAAENKITLSPEDKAALITFAGQTLESFASDFIEAKAKASLTPPDTPKSQ